MFLLAFITYVDRVCISLAAPWIETDLRLNQIEMGMVFSIFAMAYALFEVPTGWLGDRYGQRRIISRILVWWSAFTALTGMVYRFSTLLSVRFLFGAGEAGAYPNMTRAVANWFPSHRRGTAMGVIWMGSRLGAAMTPPLVLASLHWLGWRQTFWLLGAVGVLWAAVWFWWYRDTPFQKSSVNVAELEIITESNVQPAPAHKGDISWKKLLADHNLLSINSMYFTLGFTYYLYITWFPLYLLRRRHVTVSQLGLYASLPLVFSTVAAVTGGLVTDKLVHAYGLRWGRRIIGMTGCAASAVLLTAGLQVSSPHAAIWLISSAAAGCDLTLAASWATCADVGGSFSGTISGMMNMAGNIGSALSPVLMGLFIEDIGSWNLTFYIAAALNLVGMLLWSQIDANRKIQATPAM